MKKYEAIAASLRDRIRSGYPPGSELPARLKLAAEYRASQNTVGHALDLLRAEGWIETAQGARTVVLGHPEPPLTLEQLAAQVAELRDRVAALEANRI